MELLPLDYRSQEGRDAIEAAGEGDRDAEAGSQNPGVERMGSLVDVLRRLAIGGVTIIQDDGEQFSTNAPVPDRHSDRDVDLRSSSFGSAWRGQRAFLCRCPVLPSVFVWVAGPSTVAAGGGAHRWGRSTEGTRS